MSDATKTLTVAEFLLARIADDKEAARGPVLLEHKGYKPHPELSRWRFQPDGYSYGEGDIEFDWDDPGPYAEPIKVTSSSEDSSVHEAAGRHIARWDPARVLAECEAKWRIAKALDVSNRNATPVVATMLEFACRSLAQPYADHPDYRPEWRL